MKPQDNFRWTHKGKDAIIILEGNEKYVPAPVVVDPSLPQKERIDIIRRRIRHYNWKNWFEEAVSVAVKATEESLVREFLHDSVIDNLIPNISDVSELTSEQIKEFAKDDTLVQRYGRIMEAIEYHGICLDCSGNEYHFDKDTIKWFDSQIRRLESAASTNIQIAKWIWREQIDKIIWNPQGV